MVLVFHGAFHRHRIAIVVLLTVFIACGTWGGAKAYAASPAPAWQLTTVPTPSPLPSRIGKLGEYYIVAENIGGAEASGEITMTDALPSGLKITRVEAEPEAGPNGERFVCENTANEVTCHTDEPVVPSGFIVLTVAFEVTGQVSGTNSASVSGDGISPVSEDTPVRLLGAGETPSPGIQQFRFQATGPAGEPVTQAGAHPHFLTTSAVFNNQFVEVFTEGALNGKPAKGVQPAKDLVFYLPLGTLGNPTVADLCPASQIEAQNESSGCPASSRVGTILPMILSDVFAGSSDPTHEYGIYNVAPEKGFAAEFAFFEIGYTFFLYTNVVRHDGEYVLRVAIPGVPTIASPIGFISTFYGDVTEPYSSDGEEFHLDRGGFLTTPSDCGESSEAREAAMTMNTWEDPSPIPASVDAFPSLENCASLPFASDLRIKPETKQADEPSGYTVGLEIPQAPNTGTALATPPVKKVDITFPEGTSVSPSSANGLVACQETGPDGINIEGAEAEATAADGLPQPVAGHCPKASEIGTASAKTPLLREELKGHLFLAQPLCGGSGQPACSAEYAEHGQLFRLYLELEAPERGVIIKLKGDAAVNPQTGRVEAEFNENPQFPFSELLVETNHGARAPLANPQTCGTATTQGEITAWSAPETPTAKPSSAFPVDWNGEGGACPASDPFVPSVTAGTTSPQAGASTPFSLLLKREDREQDVSSLSTTLPAGLLAAVSNVAQCPEPQASAGGCPASSQVGTATVAVGSGGDPYWETGQVYFTGPYDGAPFGLSVVVPAVAGPFDLGNVIVRVALSINPQTTQVTAQSGALPQIIDGVPLRIRTIDVTLDNPRFTFNATGCATQQISTTVVSTQGARSTTSTPYTTSGCRKLPFKPAFTVSTQGNGETQGHGASLDVKIAAKQGPAQGGEEEANIAKVDVSLPSALASRLKVLQKACTEAQFAANPAGCPPASDVGTATVRTPILNAPLTGPAYLVSHGGAAFPDLVLLLQGEGVEIELVGHTDIKGAITYSRFETVPDAPVSAFQLDLPEGPDAVLGATESLCRPTKTETVKKRVALRRHGHLLRDKHGRAVYKTEKVHKKVAQALIMPTTMTAQNGAVLEQSTKIAVTGCPKAKPAKRHRRRKRAHRRPKR